MEVEVRLFDINKMKIELYDKFSMNTFFEKELGEICEDYKNIFGMVGVESKGILFRVKDRERFIRETILKYFKGYKFIEKKGVEVGHPDYIIENEEGNRIYLELKVGEDTLRIGQLIWFIENKDKIGKIINICWVNDFVPDLNNDSNI